MNSQGFLHLENVKFYLKYSRNEEIRWKKNIEFYPKTNTMPVSLSKKHNNRAFEEQWGVIPW